MSVTPLTDALAALERGKTTRDRQQRERLPGVLRRLVERSTVAQIHGAFGAPGDWGYDTALGDALFRLYRAPSAPDRLGEIRAGAIDARGAIDRVYSELNEAREAWGEIEEVREALDRILGSIDPVSLTNEEAG